MSPPKMNQIWEFKHQILIDLILLPDNGCILPTEASEAMEIHCLLFLLTALLWSVKMLDMIP